MLISWTFFALVKEKNTNNENSTQKNVIIAAIELRKNTESLTCGSMNFRPRFSDTKSCMALVTLSTRRQRITSNF